MAQGVTEGFKWRCMHMGRAVARAGITRGCGRIQLLGLLTPRCVHVPAPSFGFTGASVVAFGAACRLRMQQIAAGLPPGRRQRCHPASTI